MHLRSLGFLALLAVAAAASGQSSSPVARFFPFHPGARWTYRFEQSIEGAGPNADNVAGSWSDMVSNVERISPSLQIVEISRKGTLPRDFDECPAGTATPGTVQLWYVLQPTRIFIRCTGPEARSLAATLTAAPAAVISPDDGPDYVLPFRVGAFWANDPAVRRDDAMYRWNVTATGTVTVPAGRFTGCFDTSYDTMPDDDERWVCPGVGLVREDYGHHGTTNEIRIQLTRFQPGTAQAH